MVRPTQAPVVDYVPVMPKEDGPESADKKKQALLEQTGHIVIIGPQPVPKPKNDPTTFHMKGGLIPPSPMRPPHEWVVDSSLGWMDDLNTYKGFDVHHGGGGHHWQLPRVPGHLDGDAWDFDL